MLAMLSNNVNKILPQTKQAKQFLNFFFIKWSNNVRITLLTYIVLFVYLFITYLGNKQKRRLKQ